MHVSGGLWLGILTLYERCLTWIDCVLNSLGHIVQLRRSQCFAGSLFGNSLATSGFIKGLGFTLGGLDFVIGLLGSLPITLLLTSIFARV